MPKHTFSPAPKILYFTDSNGWGGAENYLYKLVVSFNRLAYHPIVIIPEGDEIKTIGSKLAKQGVSTRTLSTSNKHPIRSFMRALSCFIQLQPDIIHFNLSWPSFCQYPILAALLLLKTVILTEHSVFTDYVPPPIEKMFKRIIYARIFQAITVSHANKKNLVGTYKIPESKITVIHNGIDDAAFCDSLSYHEDQGFCRLTEGKTVLTTIARIDRNKAHHVLIEAAQYLRHLPNICFVIVGTGPAQEELVAELKRTGLGDRFTLLGFRSDIPFILSKTDIFVLSSFYEGMPFTVLEAMAAGKPVIASRVGGIPEAVVDSSTGILVDPGDAAAFAQAIEELISNPARRQQMGKEAIKRVREHFLCTTMIARTKTIYDQALAAWQKYASHTC